MQICIAQQYSADALHFEWQHPERLPEPKSLGMLLDSWAISFNMHETEDYYCRINLSAVIREIHCFFSDQQTTCISLIMAEVKGEPYAFRMQLTVFRNLS